MVWLIVAHNAQYDWNSYATTSVRSWVQTMMSVWAWMQMFVTLVGWKFFWKDKKCILTSFSSLSERHWKTPESQRTSAGLGLAEWPATEPCSCVSLRATPTSLWTVSRTLQTGAWEWPSHYDCSCMGRYEPPAHNMFMSNCLVNYHKYIDFINNEALYMLLLFKIEFSVWNNHYLIVFLGGWKHHRKGRNPYFYSTTPETADVFKHI